MLQLFIASFCDQTDIEGNGSTWQMLRSLSSKLCLSLKRWYCKTVLNYRHLPKYCQNIKLFTVPESLFTKYLRLWIRTCWRAPSISASLSFRRCSYCRRSSDLRSVRRCKSRGLTGSLSLEEGKKGFFDNTLGGPSIYYVTTFSGNLEPLPRRN